MKADRILVRGTNWLGDAVMTTPALLRLREKFPAAHIALLAPEKLSGLWLHHPSVDETISFAPGDNVFSIGRKLRVGKFDLALVLPNSPRSAIEVFLGRIPQRVGYARRWRNLFLTEAVARRPSGVKMRKQSIMEIKELMTKRASTGRLKPEIPGSAHQIFEYLNLMAAPGASSEPLPPQLFVTPGEIEAAKKKFGLEKISGSVFGLNPGAEYGPAKRWPVEKFIAAAQEIQRQTNCVWLLFGGKSDQPLTAQIESALRNPQPAATVREHGGSAILNLAGKTSLRELMALLKVCSVVLTNDTGPMHVAAALGTPVVVPFGSTSPELTGPGLPGDSRNRLIKSDASCSPCFLRECPIDFRCMNGIGVDRVIEAVLQVVR